MGKNMTALYALTQQYMDAANKLADMDLDEQTLADTLEGLSGDFEAKAVSVAMIACTALRELSDGSISCEKWSRSSGQREQVTVPGAPELMGKRIGLLLQEECGTYEGKETHKMLIFGVFSAASELTASEILDKKTTPAKLSKMVEALMARPVRDNRKKGASQGQGQTGRQSSGAADDPFGDMDDVPFN